MTCLEKGTVWFRTLIGWVYSACISYIECKQNNLQKDSWKKKINIFTFNKPKMFWNRVLFSNSNCPRGNRIKPASTPEANLDEGQNYAVSFIKSLFYFGKLLQCLLSNTYSAKLSFQNVICKIGFKTKQTKWSLLIGIKKYAFCQCYDANERVKVCQLNNKMSITFLFSFVICYGW